MANCPVALHTPPFGDSTRATLGTPPPVKKTTRGSEVGSQSKEMIVSALRRTSRHQNHTRGGGVLLSGSGRCKETSQKEMKESSREIVARLFRRDGDHFTSTIGRPVEMMPVWMVVGGG
jgi:hypothetical protein